MAETIKLLEELSFRTLPALDEEHYDGWVLRWSDGGSRRGNSVNGIKRSAVPLVDKIRHCESWFDQRGAPTIFRLTPLVDEALDDTLDGLGYERSAPTAVMTAALATHRHADIVTVSTKPPPEWLETIPGVNGRDPEQTARLEHQLTSGGGQSWFASIAEDGLLAIGLSVHLGGYSTIYNMNTPPRLRRRGHARSILDTLMALGEANGNTRAVLQVTKDNDAALSLYRAAGFSTIYSYHYRQKPDDETS